MIKKCEHAKLLYEEADNWWRCLDCGKFFKDEKGEHEVIFNVNALTNLNPGELISSVLAKHFWNKF